MKHSTFSKSLYLTGTNCDRQAIVGRRRLRTRRGRARRRRHGCARHRTSQLTPALAARAASRRLPLAGWPRGPRPLQRQVRALQRHGVAAANTATAVHFGDAAVDEDRACTSNAVAAEPPPNPDLAPRTPVLGCHAALPSRFVQGRRLHLIVGGLTPALSCAGRNAASPVVRAATRPASAAAPC